MTNLLNFTSCLPSSQFSQFLPSLSYFLSYLSFFFLSLPFMIKYLTSCFPWYLCTPCVLIKPLPFHPSTYHFILPLPPHQPFLHSDCKLSRKTLWEFCQLLLRTKAKKTKMFLSRASKKYTYKSGEVNQRSRRYDALKLTPSWKLMQLFRAVWSFSKRFVLPCHLNRDFSWSAWLFLYHKLVCDIVSPELVILRKLSLRNMSTSEIVSIKRSMSRNCLYKKVHARILSL